MCQDSIYLTSPAGTIAASFIESVSWNDRAFDERLVFDQTKKEAIEALITVHLEMTKSMDIIEGKGNGLIILLHGGPGKSPIMRL